MAKKNKAHVDIEVPTVVPEPDDPNLVGIDLELDGTYDMVPLPTGYVERARQIRVDDVDYEHVEDDALGRWLYRRM